MTEEILDHFLMVAQLAQVAVPRAAIRVEMLHRPHTPPSSLPAGKAAVYVFGDQECVLKVGKAGRKSQARYTRQHYTPGSAGSTLADSLLADSDMVRKWGLAEGNVAGWLMENTDRVNFLLDAEVGPLPLALLEVLVQCRLQPAYEGRRS